MSLSGFGESPEKAGWWPDPWDPTVRRYWNGNHWGKEVKTVEQVAELEKVQDAVRRKDEIKSPPKKTVGGWGPKRKGDAGPKKKSPPKPEPETPEEPATLDRPAELGPHGEKPLFNTPKKKSPPKKAPPIREPDPAKEEVLSETEESTPESSGKTPPRKPGGGFRAARKAQDAAPEEEPKPSFKPKKARPTPESEVETKILPEVSDNESSDVDEEQDTRLAEAESAFAALNGSKDKETKERSLPKMGSLTKGSMPKVSIPNFAGKSMFVGMSPVSLIVAAIFVLVILIGPLFASNVDSAQSAKQDSSQATSQNKDNKSEDTKPAEDPEKVVIGNAACNPLRKSIQEYVANGRDEKITSSMRNNLAGALSSNSIKSKKLKSTILKANQEDNFKLVAAACNLS